MSATLFDGPDASPRLRSDEWFVAHCDGGSRGNPGPAGFGAIVEDGQGKVVARLSEFLGRQTNNYAEYSGLLAVLKWAGSHGVQRLRIQSDSELMVKQMSGQYKVASPGLKPLWEEARRLARQFAGFELKHTLRDGNKEADRLANEAMDRGMGKASSGGVRAVPSPASSGRSEPSGDARPPVAARPQQLASHTSQRNPDRQILEGYVKGGVVHLLEGELPDGIFVKVIRE